MADVNTVTLIVFLQLNVRRLYAKHFQVTVYDKSCTGSGSSKQKAKEEAAARLYQLLQVWFDLANLTHI